MARLCPYEEAKEIINAANKFFKNEKREVWVHASKLEEANGNPDKCEILISRGISKIAKRTRVFEREEWIDEAQACEKANCLYTCRAIIKAVYELDAKEKEFSTTWIEDANLAMQRGNRESVRIMFDTATELLPQEKKLWDEYISFEQKIGDKEKYNAVLQRAASVAGMNSHEFLLKLSQELLKAGESEKAKELLKGALEAHPTEEVFHLAYAEILKQIRNFPEARAVIQNAEAVLASSKVWQYHIKFERDIGEINSALQVCQQAAQKFPYDIEIGCSLSTIYEEMGNHTKARENYLSLTKNPRCMTHSKPWIQYMKLEEKLGGPQKARTVAENAKKFVQHNPELWYQIIKLEERAKNFKILKPMLAEAVKDCPKDEEIWAMMVENEPRAGRLRMISQAMESFPRGAYLINVAARLFWQELKPAKTTDWFERSLQVNANLGDTWAFYYLFREEQKDEDMKQAVLQRCISASPTEGRLWKVQAERPKHWDYSTEQILMLVVEDARRHIETMRH